VVPNDTSLFRVCAIGQLSDLSTPVGGPFPWKPGLPAFHGRRHLGVRLRREWNRVSWMSCECGFDPFAMADLRCSDNCGPDEDEARQAMIDRHADSHPRVSAPWKLGGP
jgi:hypothetical protein